MSLTDHKTDPVAGQRAPDPPSRGAAALRIALGVHAIALLVIGGVAAVHPGLLADRFAPLDGIPPAESLSATLKVVRWLAIPGLLAGVLGLFAVARPGPLSRRGIWIAALAAGLGSLSLACCLQDWIIDDAAITFAYSENLVRGYGLVLHPGHVPEEAYSTTLWMLLLAGVRALGVPMALGAKVMCAMAGTAAVVIAVRCSARLLGPGADYSRLFLAGATAIGAPFAIWSCSGLEHALQALVMVSIVALGFSERPRIWATSACLGALMLLRPETPLLVAAVASVYGLEFWRTRRERRLAFAPILVVPLVVGLALLGFRLAYFGVPFPNPYYAKAQSATFLRVLNIFGSAWGYVLKWLFESGAVALVPVLVLGLARDMSRPVRIALAIAAAQVAFILYAGGDWMKCYRFLAPILPVLAVAVSGSLADLGRLYPARVGISALALSWLLGHGTVEQLREFRARPTTPESVVAEIGRTFVDLAARMGIDHPTLADHDAGGTSWEAGIDVVDLGGLGNRAIAQHMDDPEFMRRYLFVERRPTFVFGSTTTFAAGRTHFHTMPEFEEQYVPVRFPGRPAMISGLCHMRRDAVREVPGVRVVQSNGRVVEVVVEGD